MDLAPIRNTTISEKPWEGSMIKKPWDYTVSVMIPTLDVVEPLKLVIELLQLQTVRPYILIFDTGSLPETYKQIEELRCDNIEVHSMKLNGVEHPSDFVAMACDWAAAICRTPYILYTHNDCFLRKQTVIEELLEQCTEYDAVGYKISPRAHAGWETFFGHTLLMFNMEIYLKNRLMWNLKQFCYYYGIDSHKPVSERPNFPDTETEMNLLCQELGIKVKLIGNEENFQRNINEHFDHCRTYTSGLLYNSDYHKICTQWINEAMKEAKQRILEWKQ